MRKFEVIQERCYSTASNAPDPDAPITHAPCSVPDDEREKARLRRLVQRGQEAERRLEETTYRMFQEVRQGSPPEEGEDVDPLSESMFRAWREWQGKG